MKNLIKINDNNAFEIDNAAAASGKPKIENPEEAAKSQINIMDD